jgi:hypothetical protein
MANGEDPEDIKKRSAATEENSESNKENAESLDQQGESAEKAADKVSKLQSALDGLKGSFDVEQARDFLGVMRDQVTSFENLDRRCPVLSCSSTLSWRSPKRTSRRYWFGQYGKARVHRATD